jgi:hypothetical protein
MLSRSEGDESPWLPGPNQGGGEEPKLARLSGFSLLENFFDAGSSVFSRIGVPGGGLNRL